MQRKSTTVGGPQIGIWVTVFDLGCIPGGGLT